MRTSRQVPPHPEALRTAAISRNRRPSYGQDFVSTLVGGTALLLTMSVFLGLA